MQKGNILMKPSRCLTPLLLLCLALTGAGCSHSERSKVDKAVRSELDLLRNLDSVTVQKYVSYTDLFPEEPDSQSLTSGIENVFTLFFQNFDYKILEVRSEGGSGKASVKVQLKTLDACSLARDYTKARLREEILNAARNSDGSSASVPLSLEGRYLLLGQQLKENTYATIETLCDVKLEKSGRKWSIIRSLSLEDDLVGGLITYLSDPNLLSPEETLAVCFNTLKEMNEDELSAYLGVSGFLLSETQDEKSMAAALSGQVIKCFDFEILESEVSGYNAQVSAEITSFDSNAIVEMVQKETRAYLESPQAVVDGPEIRHEHCLEILISCIADNEAVIRTTSVFHMVNNGACWNLSDEGQELGHALFGSFPQDGTALSDTFLAEADSQDYTEPTEEEEN